MIQLFLGTEGVHGSALMAAFHFNKHVCLTQVSKIEGEPTPTAKLTAKPVILSTSQCISAIQHNTEGRVSKLSQAVPATLTHPQRGNTRSIPNTLVDLLKSESMAAILAVTPMISDGE
jgi:hypothetical protein